MLPELEDLRWGIDGARQPDWMWSSLGPGTPCPVHFRGDAPRTTTTTGTPIRKSRARHSSHAGWYYTSVPNTDHYTTTGYGLNVGAGDFTIQCYIWHSGGGTAPVPFTANRSTGAYPFSIYTRLNTTTRWGTYLGGWRSSGAAADLATSAYHHLLIRRQSNTVSFWHDGVQEPTTYSISGTIPDSGLGFGAAAFSNNYWQGVFFWSAVHESALSDAEIVACAERAYMPYAEVEDPYLVPGVAGGGETLTMTDGTVDVDGEPFALTETLHPVEGSVDVDGEAFMTRLIARSIVDEGAINVDGEAFTLRTLQRETVDEGAVNIDGQSFVVNALETLSMTEGSIAVAGQDFTLREPTSVLIDAGSFDLSGQAFIARVEGDEERGVFRPVTQDVFDDVEDNDP